jgi:hypothetical protein
MVIGTSLNLWKAMSNNNFRIEATSVQRVFDEIMMEFTCDNHKKRVGILVESKQNELFFRKLLSKNCTFFPADGWEKVEAILRQINLSSMKGIIGIIDADFKRVLAKINTTDNLFWTDYHDTEIMCIYSPAWENVLDFYIQKDKFDTFKSKNGEDFRAYLMEVSKPISALRLLNEKENLGLKFKTLKKDNSFDFIDFEAFTDYRTLKIDIKKLCDTVERKSSKLGFFKRNPALEMSLNEILSRDFDLKELNNGHDILNMLSVALSDAISNKKSSTKVANTTLENDFIKGYRVADFRLTNLYQALKIWQNSHTDFLVLK